MATQMDDDPFVDFSYGFITGATAEEAAAFVERGIKAEQTKREPDLGNISVWDVAKSQLVRSVFPLRNRSIPQLEGRLASPGDLKNGGRDTQFIKEFLPKLSGKSLVIVLPHPRPASENASRNRGESSRKTASPWGAFISPPTMSGSESGSALTRSAIGAS